MAGPLAPHVQRIEAVLEGLRRSQQQLARDPRGTLQSAARQLLAGGRDRPSPQGHRYRVDDLAQASGVTVRNIRAYQERGLLHAPVREGRVVWFDETHLSRLRIITSMLERGYTTAHILEMLSAWERGKDLSDVLGLEQALVPSQTPDLPAVVTRTEAERACGGAADLDLVIAAGLAERQGAKVRLLRPRLLESFAEMRTYGIALPRLLDLHASVTPLVDRISALLVDAGVEQVADQFPLTDHHPLTGEELGELVVKLTRFRTAAITAVADTVETSVEARVEELLADYLKQVARPG